MAASTRQAGRSGPCWSGAGCSAPCPAWQMQPYWMAASARQAALYSLRPTSEAQSVLPARQMQPYWPVDRHSVTGLAAQACSTGMQHSHAAQSYSHAACAVSPKGRPARQSFPAASATTWLAALDRADPRQSCFSHVFSSQSTLPCASSQRTPLAFGFGNHRRAVQGCADRQIIRQTGRTAQPCTAPLRFPKPTASGALAGSAWQCRLAAEHMADTCMTALGLLCQALPARS